MYSLQRDKNINMLFHVSVVFGLICGFIHLTKFLFDMVLSVAFFQKLNIPSFAFITAHLLMIYVPLFLISPNSKKPKAITLRWIFLVISICYVLGCTWIFYYMADNSFTKLFTEETYMLASYQYDNALMYNYMTWICFSPLNVVFSLIQAGLFFFMSESLIRHKAVFSLSIIISTIFSLLIPSIFVVFRPELLEHSYAARLFDYFLDNLFLFGSQVCTTIALVSISLSRRMWETFLWTYSQNR